MTKINTYVECVVLAHEGVLKVHDDAVRYDERPAPQWWINSQKLPGGGWQRGWQQNCGTLSIHVKNVARAPLQRFNGRDAHGQKE